MSGTQRSPAQEVNDMTSLQLPVWLKEFEYVLLYLDGAFVWRGSLCRAAATNHFERLAHAQMSASCQWFACLLPVIT